MYDQSAMRAQAELYHQYFLGLQLMVAVNEPAALTEKWMFRLFRRQHEEKFLSSFAKLGLDGLPDAVACAQYHVLSNSIGGVAVEYAYERDDKAWVRFRYPRWMYDGAVICGIPVESSRGVLRGWYAHNGVSLQNPQLGFVCVSEDMTGQYGLCGYFKEYAHDLSSTQRLQFAPHERPPKFDPKQQPVPPAHQWSDERLAKAHLNYAMEYVRNGVRALVAELGQERAMQLCHRAARLTGLQHFNRMALEVGAGVEAEIIDGGGPSAAADFMLALWAGIGEACQLSVLNEHAVQIEQRGIRLVRGLPLAERHALLSCCVELWRGTLQAQRELMQLDARIHSDGEGIDWAITG